MISPPEPGLQLTKKLLNPLTTSLMELTNSSQSSLTTSEKGLVGYMGTWFGKPADVPLSPLVVWRQYHPTYFTCHRSHTTTPLRHVIPKLVGFKPANVLSINRWHCPWPSSNVNYQRISDNFLSCTLNHHPPSLFWQYTNIHCQLVMFIPFTIPCLGPTKRNNKIMQSLPELSHWYVVVVQLFLMGN